VLPQTEKYLHGTKVAYGILVQSALLGQDDVLAQLVRRISALTCRPRWRAGRRYQQPRRAGPGHCPYPAPGGVDSLFTGDVNA
jgi:hypothetical protein